MLDKTSKRRGRLGELGSRAWLRPAPPRSSSTTSRSATRGASEAAVEDLSLTIPAGEICILVGPSGRRQDDRDEDRQPADRARRGRHPDRRDEHPRPGRRRAPPRDRLRDPAGRPLPAHDDRRQHRDRPAAPRLADATAQRARVAELLELVGLEAEYAQALPGAALGRAAPAGRPGARARRRPAADADGRAVRRARPDHARPPAARVPAAARRGAQDGHLRHARHRRGDQARRPDRDPPRGRRSWRSTTRPTGCSPTRPTSSSRGSSARTEGSSGSRCGGSTRSSSSPSTGAPRRTRRARPGRRPCATRSR